MDLRQALIRLATEVPALRASLVPLLRKHAYTFPREFYLPKDVKDTPPLVPEGTDLAVWKWEVGTRPVAIIFQGKAAKPLWGPYGFPNEAARDKKIEDYAAARRQSLGAKAKAQEDRRNYIHNVKIGDIFYTSWGYDQTNVDFYQVTNVIGKQVAVRAIGTEVVQSNGPSGNRVVPKKDHFIGEAVKKTPQGSGSSEPYLSMDGHSAHLWDGKPVYETDSQFGH